MQKKIQVIANLPGLVYNTGKRNMLLHIYWCLHELKGRNATYYSNKINILDSDYDGRDRALEAQSGQFFTKIMHNT